MAMHEVLWIPLNFTLRVDQLLGDSTPETASYVSSPPVLSQLSQLYGNARRPLKPALIPLTHDYFSFLQGT